MRCPVCRADNDQGPQCRRCRADLGLLYRLQDQRRVLRDSAMSALAAGNLDEAMILAQRVYALGRDDQSQQLLAVVHLLRRDYRQALHRHGKVSAVADS